MLFARGGGIWRARRALRVRASKRHIEGGRFHSKNELGTARLVLTSPLTIGRRIFTAVSKPELGVKRICANCGGKFYDLHNDPIVCLSEMADEAIEVTEDATSVETLDGAAVLVDGDDADEDVGSIVDEGEKDEQV